VKVHFAAPLDRSARRLRLGLVVPKKLLRTSVRRNTAKRHIREAFRLMQHALPLGDYVVRVVAHERALPLSVWQRAFRAELDQIVHQASVALTRPPSGGGR
jgi:ribonuclease P protein component